MSIEVDGVCKQDRLPRYVDHSCNGSCDFIMEGTTRAHSYQCPDPWICKYRVNAQHCRHIRVLDVSELIDAPVDSLWHLLHSLTKAESESALQGQLHVKQLGIQLLNSLYGCHGASLCTFDRR